MDGVGFRVLVWLAAAAALGVRCPGCDDGRHHAAREQEPAPIPAFSSCIMCHVDLEEQLAKGAHGRAGLTCDSCHGDSQGHVTDEHNNVKPGRVFTADTASSLCGECHKEHFERAEAVAGAPGCIECHGAHEILTGQDAKKARKRLRVMRKPH